jgi:TonB family protein
MKAIYTLALLFVFASATAGAVDTPDASSPAHAPCQIGEMPNRLVLSPEKFALARDMFRALCAKSAGDLVNGEDTQLSSRLTFPTTPEATTNSNYPLEALKHRIEGAAIVTYIVETDGRVSWVSVLTSTGNPDLDAAAYWRFKNAVSKVPPMLDGKPVRMYRMQLMTFKLT